MKRFLLIVLALVFILYLWFIIIGINENLDYTEKPNILATAPNIEEMEVYKTFIFDTAGEPSLEEALDAFAKMCRTPMDTNTDLYLLQININEYEGQKFIDFGISHQFTVPEYYEFLEIGFTFSYPYEEGMDIFKETRFFEGNLEGFLEYVQNHDAYNLVKTRDVSDRNIGYGYW